MPIARSGYLIFQKKSKRWSQSQEKMIDMAGLKERFFEAMNDYEASEDDSNFVLLRQFLFATYEYFRHITCIDEEFDIDQKTQIRQKLPNILSKFKKGHTLMDLSFTLEEKDIFDYLKFRSAVEFLTDNFVSFLDDPSEYDFFALQDGFQPRQYFLTYNYEGDYKNPYPTDPLPEHAGVPESHWWWKRAETHRIK